MPQLRVNLETIGAEDLACTFGAPVILDAKIRDGSLRQAASELGIPLLVYEGGEALRFNELCIRAGLRGIMNVLHALDIIPTSPSKKSLAKAKYQPIIAHASLWVRAPTSGLLQPIKDIGEPVIENDALAFIHDPFDMNASTTIFSPLEGIIVGKTNLPLVNEGDALYNIATVKNLEETSIQINEITDELH